ncbi:exocyst complex component Sec10-like protein [Halteromyces radiatus]|uniref:exocyst complex component Sec10-like protein n=1 Tax=Halteromyces radiatus TaxID=101107 RepID=UPI00221F0A28|nr:exocyst complex component Sec10-like protein [Halteromyces radiatus]KAI8089981.1 exocyst complex component Sec10-like protein [Halteromyces radiatus]
MGSRSKMYHLEPEIKELLTINNFKEDFSTNDFIEAISSTLMERMKKDSGKVVLDPKPFVRTFEQVLEELQQLRIRVQHQCDELELGTQKAEQQYKQNIVNMQDAFKDVYQSYDSLETRIGDVGKTAVRIGEQLETLDKQRSRATESRDVIEYYMEFQDAGYSERLDILYYESGDEGQFKAASLARRLNSAAKEVKNDTKARVGIEKFCERFEKEMLEEFDKAYREGDPRVMAHCARVLFEFNGGSSCVQTYVNQHEFFISNMQTSDLSERVSSEDDAALSNPFIPPPEVDTSLINLYDEIRTTVQREVAIISAVFPQPALVIQVFLQRIFAQSIQDQVETLLSRAQNISNLAYLRTLASIHAATKQLVDSLKVYCEKARVQSTTNDDTGLVSVASSEETLDRCMDDLFVPYTEGNRYLYKEKACLNELFGGMITEFLNFMQQYKKTSARNQSVLTRTLNQISASTTSTILSPSSFTESEHPSPISATSAHGLDFPNTTTSAQQMQSNLIKVDDSGFYLISPEAILRIIQIHSEAILRCVELMNAQELSMSVKQLYDILLDFVGSKYLDIVLDEIYDELGGKTEPDLVCFPVISASTNISQLLQRHFQTAVVPLVIGTPSVHRDSLVNKNKFLSTLETKVNSVVTRSIEAITYWLNETLAKQKKNDFRPKDEEVVMMSNGTMPCVYSVEFLTKIYRAAIKTLQGKNLESYLLNVGSEFHSLLVEHFKKYYVTPTGGLLVTKDIAKYQEVIMMFKIPTLNDRFEMLRQLGNIFVVKPEILRSILSEGYLARLEPNVLYPYLEKRADFKTARLDRILGISVDENGSTGSTSHTNQREQRTNQRRSLFVNDNRVLREMMNTYSNKNDFLSSFHLT